MSGTAACPRSGLCARACRLVLPAVTLAAWGAVGFALFSQQVWGMQPCPWCVLQRLIFLLLGAAALAAWALPRWRRALAWTGALLGVGGIAAALWQQLVAASSSSCDLTLADHIVRVTHLWDIAPALFEPTASCLEASVSLLGVPYALWSLALFTALTAALVLVARRQGACVTRA